MQDQWYGDKRDLVKWGTLLELAHKYKVNQILQVLYHRSNTWNPIEIDGDFVPIPAEVIQHFSRCKINLQLEFVCTGTSVGRDIL
jgi:predicted methyltransferase